MIRVGIVDHGAGNLVSIEQSLKRVGADPIVSDDPAVFDACDAMVLPGVGTTRAVMDGITQAGFADLIRQWERPMLGICVGMQVMFENSDEDGALGFGFAQGSVRRLESAPRLPHIGWNDVMTTDDPLFAGLNETPTFYFVHSFAPPPSPGTTIGTTTYGDTFSAAVRIGRRVGTQFHPERSGDNGLTLLANFVEETP